MKLKKLLSALLLAALVLVTAASFASCGNADPDGKGSDKSKKITIAIPNDPSNEARALILLEAEGFIKLKEGAGITATVRDIAEKPANLEFVEVAAEQLPNVLQDNDYAIINTNYAIEAGLSPKTDSFLLEGAYSAYSNIVAVKEGNENTDKAKALAAALKSKKVADYIAETYDSNVLSTVETLTDGFDSSVDYDALTGTAITVAATPSPHGEILKVAKEILAEKNITLDIKEFTDYTLINPVLESGEVDANYFQHLPYLEDFNETNGSHIVSIASIHVEPMGLYGGKQTSVDALNALKN